MDEENKKHEDWKGSTEIVPRKKNLPMKTRSIRSINPLGMRVVVRIAPDTNVTEGGLYLPEGAKQNMQESLLCEVVEVASAIDSETEEETNISGIPSGSMVLIPKKAGISVPWDDQLRIVDTKEVLAIVVENHLS